MAFYLGQKVVCVDASNTPGRQWFDGEAPIEGEVYTVKSVHLDWEGDLVLWLREIDRSDVLKRRYGPSIGYGARRFRPITERKTDIAIFKAMLNPSKTEVTA